MKLRIQDNSVRFRITIRELEKLTDSGVLTSETRIPCAGGNSSVFKYTVSHDASASATTLRLEPCEFELKLSQADFDQLADPAREGTYIQREWSENGETHRFMVFIEKDRPGSACIKPEAWVYDMRHGQESTVVAIRAGAKAAKT